MVISHNLAAINAQRQFGINTNNKSKTAEKLSSGYRINRAADDAAGLSISEKMRKQIRGLSQGVENAQTGVSLCQVADGALNEVASMLQRISELSVQSANGTNSESDREAIQAEIDEIVMEIDRIGDTTTFNEMPVFRGTEQVITNDDGTAAKFGELAFSDFELVNVDLGKTPLVNGENADSMHLQAVVKKQDSVLDGKTFNLIYGSGSTSNSSLRITDTSGNKIVINMDELTLTDFQQDTTTNEWSRTFTYAEGTDSEVSITQKIKLDSSKQTDTEKNYTISYEFSKGSDIQNVEFMFHVDTAYNNNDRCEGYFINGARVEEYCIYNQNSNGSDLVSGSNNTNINNGTMPDSLSIIDVENALAFSEKITFNNNRKPDSLSIGHYSEIDDWDYYNSNSLDNSLGENTNSKDLGFSLYYNLGDLQQGSSISFDYGIVSKGDDTNLTGVSITNDGRDATEHLEDMAVWIQSGADAGDGMYVVIGEMNTTVFGMEDLDVSTMAGANAALDIVDDALQKLSAKRSRIGAQQNRLEHTIANEENIIENTTAAESRIRDTDMAKEMVELSKQNILEQAGFSMMAQANQSLQGVLSLLQ